MIVGKMGRIDITEDNLADMLKLDDVLEELYKKAVDIKDKIYIPTLRKFLSKLTVSCFSVSGWNNQLMWSHYANSYAGICIEYDFNQIKDAIGFIYPVEYTTERPMLSLQELGVAGFNLGSDACVKSCAPDMGAILSYLLAKNVCWNYEKEWRIINVGEENTPLFIDLPFVKSVTFGMNMDPICKQLLWDVCTEKGIECYEIEIGTENYELSRKHLTKKDFTYDIDFECNYIDILTKQILAASERIDKMGQNIENEIENKNFSNVSPMLTELVSMNLNNFKDGTIRIMGKGHKERLVYLNTACIDALDHYLAARAQLPNIKDTDKNALFISKRTGGRLTPGSAQDFLCEISS